MTSDTATRGDLYDAASTVLAQKLSQVEGIGEVVVGGSSLPAVRVDLIPSALFKYGIGLEDVRAALSSANAHSPKGGIDVGDQRYQIYANDQANKADDYKSLIVAYRNGAAVHLSDVGEVTDGVENLRNSGLANGRPAVLIILYRQPGANIISTVDAVKALVPLLRASISPAIDIGVGVDRSTTIRTSLRDVERTLVLAVLLVILVVFAFLRSLRATFIPVVAVSVSLVATFGAMYLIGYSLDNLSLMALTVATGFVVDDAIVVLENVTRYIEEGLSPLEAALKGANEVGFTVLSMSVSLIAVFIPILMMGGIIGRLFREFAMVISISIMISLAISLATTPMMCAVLLRPETGGHGRLYQMSERFFEAMLGFYRRTLTSALEHPLVIVLIFFAAIGLNVYLYTVIPKGFFPQQDTGRLVGNIQADQSISFQLMQQKLAQFVTIIKKDPAVETVVGFTGGGQTNSGFMFVSLLPLSERHASVDEVIGRLRRQMSVVPGATLFLQAVQDIRVGGRASAAQYQYTLQGATLEELNDWTPKIAAALQRETTKLADVNSDQQNKGLESDVTIDRDAAARLGVTVSQIDNTLYDAFGQRQVSTIYVARNQYHVIMEVAPRYWQTPETLKDVYVSTSGGSVGGSQSTNAVAGTVVSSGTIDGRGSRECAGRPQSCHQLDRPDRQGRGLDRLCRLDQAGNHDPALGGGAFQPGRHPSGGESPGIARRQYHLVQSAAGRVAERCDRNHRIDDEQARRARDDSRHVPGQRKGVPGFARQPAVSGSGRAGHDLHRARRALRELYPSAHHPLDAAVGRRRRAAGADGVQDRIFDHGADRRHSPDRHRQEERHHDDRFRARCRAQARHELDGCDSRGLPAPLPSDHDDDHGRDAGRRSAGARPRRRRRAAPAAGNRDCRRFDPESSPDTLFHTCDLFVSGQVSPLEPTSSPRRGA